MDSFLIRYIRTIRFTVNCLCLGTSRSRRSENSPWLFYTKRYHCSGRSAIFGNRKPNWDLITFNVGFGVYLNATCLPWPIPLSFLLRRSYPSFFPTFVSACETCWISAITFFLSGVQNKLSGISRRQHFCKWIFVFGMNSPVKYNTAGNKKKMERRTIRQELVSRRENSKQGCFKKSRIQVEEDSRKLRFKERLTQEEQDSSEEGLKKIRIQVKEDSRETGQKKRSPKEVQAHRKFL